MTRTEERLADALQASAGRVRDGRLRPLPEAGLEPARERHAAWRGWLAPAAAALSVVLVIGLALTLTSAPGRLAGQAPGGHGRPASGAAGVPVYFGQFAGTNPIGGSVEIRSTATGAVVASAPSPRKAGWSVLADAMAAAPDGRTFYVAYVAQHPGTSTLPQTWIYRFSTTGSGLTLVKGGVITDSTAIGLLHVSMAVSPDGIKLALTVATPARGASGPGSMDRIVTVDLRTGTRATWQGGLDMTGRTLLISDVSWQADGRSVVFLALWCDSGLAPNLCADAFGPAGSRIEQVRAVPVASGGGLLDRGVVLMSRKGTAPVIEHALAAPDPGELTLIVLSGRTTVAGAWPAVTVERVSVRTGSVLGTDYRLVTGTGGQPSRDIELGADPSGQHLLLTYGGRGGFVTGWVNRGTLRPLPLGRQPYLGYPVTAW